MENKCRACLSTDSLFDWNELVAEDITYADMFYHITNMINDKPDDIWLCCECGIQLDEIYKFIQKATLADKEFHKPIFQVEIKRRGNDEMSVVIAPAVEEDFPDDEEQNELPQSDFDENQYESGTAYEEYLDKYSQHESEIGSETKYSQDSQDYEPKTRSKKTKGMKFLSQHESEIGSETKDSQDSQDYEPKTRSKKTKAMKFLSQHASEIKSETKDSQDSQDYEPKTRSKKTKGMKFLSQHESEIGSETKDSQDSQDYEPKKKSKKTKGMKFEMVNVKTNYSDKAASSQEEQPEQSFPCDICGKEYKSLFSQRRHMAVHSTEKFLCDVCPRSFNDRWGLKKHKRTHDENRKRNFSCQICGVKCLTANSLKGHMEVHNDKRVKRFPCDQCEKAFFHRGALNVHRRMHTGEMVQCEVCAKRYPREVDLELHMRSHTGESPFKCATCGKAFKYNSTLYNHVRKEHFGYYKCSFCSKQYKDLQGLTEHKKIHQERLFRCALCDKEMVKKYQLKRHIRGMHKIINPEELEQLIISNKSENRHRTMRHFTDVEYKEHVDFSEIKAISSRTPKTVNIKIQKMEEESSDEYQTDE